MTALAAERARRFENWKFKAFTLVSGFKAWKGGRAVLTAAGVQPASSAPGLTAFGVFAETVDATAGALPVTVDLEVEIQVERFVNATSTDAISAATDLGALAYMVDDQTVGILPQLAGVGRSVAGRILDVDPIKGVAIEKGFATARNAPGGTASIPAYTANVSSPATLVNGAVYDVPTQAAASTIVLPAGAPDGTTVSFVADGTKNGFTTVYQDATGSVALNTVAQTPAAKRHLAICTKSLGKWVANVFSAP